MLASSSPDERVLVRLVPLDVAADREPDGGAGRMTGGARRALRVAGVGHDHLRFAVVDDVARLFAGEVPVDRREAVAAAAARGPHLGELRAVPAHERERGAGLDAPAAQRAHELVGAPVELAERAVPVLAHDRRSGRAPRPTSSSPSCRAPDGPAADRARQPSWCRSLHPPCSPAVPGAGSRYRDRLHRVPDAAFGGG